MGAVQTGASSSEDLEQVYVRGMIRRSLRPEAVRGLGIALAFGVLSSMVWAQSVSTATSLNVTTHEVKGAIKATVQVSVAGNDGSAATGAVSVLDGSMLLAGVTLNGSGQASTDITLSAGTHSLRAEYAGDSTHVASASTAQAVTAETTSTPGFTLGLTAVSPSSFPMTLTAGSAGTVKVTVTPTNNSTLTAPMFVTLSCSGLPDQSSCSFSPATVEILSTTTTTCTAGSSTCPPTSTLVLQTQASGTAKNTAPAVGKHGSTIAWAVLLPGMLGLGGLAWGARRRRWLSRVAMLGMLALVTTLGATGCNPQYYYYNHGPTTNLPTPSGTYNVTVTGQSSNAITTVTDSTTMVVTVD